jgi:REP element-mobilizing transposase RayT
MPYTKLWIHLIWSTKNREPFITKELKSKLISHIKENSEIKQIHIDFINCVKDHIHILITLKPDQKLSDVIRLIKGESSFWVNKNKLIKFKFEWQDEYIAVSVSDSVVNNVRNYIKNQEEHHKTKTFMEEYKEFIKKLGFEGNVTQ